MKKAERTHKLWQSMINTDLTPDEFIKLTLLGRIREQSLRQLVSHILRDELKTFADLIEKHSNQLLTTPSLEANASKKRNRGRPRKKDARTYTSEATNASLPTSILEIIDSCKQE